MADQFLAEQHAWTLSQHAIANDEDSWVMLTRDGKIVPKPDEKILHTSRARVALELTTPPELQIANPFTLKSDNGMAYITNERVIYLPARPTDEFKSFFAPILNFDDTDVQSSWGGIGPWSWSGVVKPVPAGGIPSHIPRIDARLVFKDGGHHDFRTKFNWLKERLNHARELGLVPSENIEPPPPYEPSSSGPAEGSTSATQPTPTNQPRPPQPTPDEPPPDYVEAQAQAIAMEYDEREREEAERH